MLNRIQHAPVKGFPYNYVFHKPFTGACWIRFNIPDEIEDVKNGGKDLFDGISKVSLQLRVSLNIPSQDIHSDDVEQNEIPTLIRFFNVRVGISFCSTSSE
jgi:hypothetical protein